MPERHQERRLVTCLFIDVVGSTDLTLRLGPERLKNALEAAFAELRDVIVSHGGTVEKYVGDAIYALFGAPIAHADDPARALRVAHACLGWAAARASAAIPFAVRIGVETGEAIVDLSAAETTRQQMSVGAVVNIAARLQQRAEPGEALVGPLCRAAAGDIADLVPLGEVELKGIGALPVWSLRGIAAAAATVRLPFVGRAAELALLEAAFARARSGRSVLALVSGPPGQGKTRLVGEFVGRAAPVGQLRVVRCRPDGEIGALGPLRQFLADDDDATFASLFADPVERERVATTVRASAGIAVSEALAALGPTERADETVNAWRRYLGALARSGLLLIWVEDLHWADPAVVRLIDRVAKGSDPILVIGTARPEFAESAGLRPSGDRFFIELEGLDGEAANVLARSAGSATEEALARADGNPLFIVELARARGASDPEALPLTLQGALGARLDELAPAERDLLAHAAIAGESFSTQDAAFLAGADAAAIGAALSRLVDLQYLDATPSGYRFHHSLIRDVAYGRLLMAERMRLHAGYARTRVRPEDLEVLAHHWWAAFGPADAAWVWEGDPDAVAMRREAFTAHLAAGTEGIRSLSVARAVTLLERAIALAPDPRSVADAESVLGDAYASDAKADDAWAHYLRARDAYRAAGGAPASLYRGMLDIRTKVNAFTTVPTDEFIAALLDEAEARARATQDRSALARVVMHRGIRLYSLDDLDLLQEADRMAAETGDAAVRTETLGWLINALIERSDLDAVTPLLAERERIRAAAPGGGLASLEALEPFVTVALLGGDLAEARRQAERARALAAPMGPHLRTHALLPLSLVETAAGDWDRVRAIGHEVREIITASPGTPFCLLAAATLANAATVEALAQRADDARALVRIAESVRPSPHVATFTGLPRRLIGEAPARPPSALDLWSSVVYVALTQPSRELAVRLREQGSRGARALAALAEAVAATSEGDADRLARAQDGLRSLGFRGWSELLERSRAAAAAGPQRVGGEVARAE